MGKIQILISDPVDVERCERAMFLEDAELVHRIARKYAKDAAYIAASDEVELFKRNRGSLNPSDARKALETFDMNRRLMRDKYEIVLNKTRLFLGTYFYRAPNWEYAKTPKGRPALSLHKMRVKVLRVCKARGWCYVVFLEMHRLGRPQGTISKVKIDNVKFDSILDKLSIIND